MSEPPIFLVYFCEFFDGVYWVVHQEVVKTSFQGSSLEVFHSLWQEVPQLPTNLSIQLDRSGGGGQRGEGNVNWAAHLLEKLGGSPAMPPTTGQASGGSGSNVNLVIPINEECGIRDVWNHNLHEEFRSIRNVVLKYTYVAMVKKAPKDLYKNRIRDDAVYGDVSMGDTQIKEWFRRFKNGRISVESDDRELPPSNDTEFPGVVARPIGEFRSTADYQYQLLRCNVDLLRIIQLGLTFLDENGKTPAGYTTWQFNFKFNLSEDMYAQDSIDLLQNSGIQFKKHEEDGIDPLEFAALLMTSGVVLMDNIKWLSFHSGYDFGYLIKLLTDTNLPQDESDFFELLRLYFPVVYDVKVSKRKIFATIHQRLSETGSLKSSKHSNAGIARSCKTVELEELVLNEIYDYPEKSTRELSLQFNVSLSSIRRILHEYQLHPYHFQHVQTILPQDYAPHVVFVDGFC
ncbi:CCR4-NOT transcription complex subunit 8 [Homalodisca vitripennis]|nr:CCR4-NOT transcription complex subunit 8 [Homalodisca vitripennis]